MDSSETVFKRSLIEYFEKFGEVTSGMAHIIMKDTYLSEIKKNKHLISPLDQKPNIYFLISGAARGFFRDNGTEITTWIQTEGNLVGLTLYPEQFNQEHPQYIQAIEDTLAIVIPNPLLKTLFAIYPEMGIIGRKLLWQHYHESEQRNILMRIPRAKNRLQRMLEKDPHFLHRIPLKYLSAYLGMRLETLSRLKSQVLRNSNQIGSMAETPK